MLWRLSGFKAENDDLRMLVVLEESGRVGPSRFTRLVLDIRHHPAEFLDLGDDGFVFSLELAVLKAGKHEGNSRTSISGNCGQSAADETRVAQPPSAVLTGPPNSFSFVKGVVRQSSYRGGCPATHGALLN